MESMTTLPWSRPLTVDDLDAMPDDGHRYELIDGTLLVSPAPSDAHQSVVVNLVVLLKAACPPDLRVRVAPYDVTLGLDTRVQPDVLVTRKADITQRGLFVAPLLAVEVLSPNTWRTDLGAKMTRYADAGVPSYWLVDPDELWLRAYELKAGAYELLAEVGPGEEWTSVHPYPVRVTPATLSD